MRCGCPTCGTYMVHSEGVKLGCVCPGCTLRCTDCLGTNTLISREQLQRMKNDPAYRAELLRAMPHADWGDDELAGR